MSDPRSSSQAPPTPRLARCGTCGLLYDRVRWGSLQCLPHLLYGQDPEDSDFAAQEMRERRPAHRKEDDELGKLARKLVLTILAELTSPKSADDLVRSLGLPDLAASVVHTAVETLIAKSLVARVGTRLRITESGIAVQRAMN